MKKRYIAFIALASGLAGSAITYGNTHTNANVNVNASKAYEANALTSENNEVKITNDFDKSSSELLKKYDYSKEDITWVVSLIQFIRSDIKKQQSQELTVYQTSAVLLFSIDTLNKLKGEGKSLNYNVIPKSNIQFTDSEMSWLLNSEKNNYIDTLQKYPTNPNFILELGTIDHLSKSFAILEAKRLRENKDVVVYNTTEFPDVIQLSKTDPARSNEWDVTRIYINQIIEKATGHSIYEDNSKKTAKDIKNEIEAEKILAEAAPNLKFR